MSGGEFDYIQFRLDETAERLEELAFEFKCDGRTIDRINKAAIIVRRAAKAIHMVDWLVSGDDSEETFHEKWDEFLNENPTLAEK